MGFEESQRDQPGASPATPTSWTPGRPPRSPQIAGGWRGDPDLFERVFLMDLRPQAHDIIRTWLFATMVRSHYEHHSVPWTNAAISGWILDPTARR